MSTYFPGKMNQSKIRDLKSEIHLSYILVGCLLISLGCGGKLVLSPGSLVTPTRVVAPPVSPAGMQRFEGISDEHFVSE